jgi:hypothetical protein
MPSPCFQGAESGSYAKKHNPFAYYDQVAGNSGLCRQMVPLSRLAGDIQAGRLPTLTWIIPDLCNDMHDCPVRDGDRYLAQLLPPVLSALGPHGVLFLTWDEGSSDQGCCDKARGGHVVTIVAGPSARRGATSSVSYDHYSLLRTVENLFGLPPLRDAACSCTAPMNDLLAGP